MSVEEHLTDALGISPSTSSAPNNEIQKRESNELAHKEPVALPDDHYDDDFEFARKNLRRLVARSEEAMEDANRLASETQHARSFEVLGQLLRISLDANKDLMDLHGDKKKIEQSSGKTDQSSNTTVNGNAIFVGTPEELQKAIQQQKHQDRLE